MPNKEKKEFKPLSVPEPEPINLPEPEKFPLRELEDAEFLRPVSAAPSFIPSHPLERIQLYSSGGTKRLYVFDSDANTWHYAALT